MTSNNTSTTQATLSPNVVSAFNAIQEFVADLDANFGRRYKPVALYNRLLQKTTLRDVASINRHINAFKLFYSQNPSYITTSSSTTTIGIGGLVDGACVRFSERIVLHLQSILRRTDHRSHDCIRGHLLTIHSLIFASTPDGNASAEALRRLDSSTNDEQQRPRTVLSDREVVDQPPPVYDGDDNDESANTSNEPEPITAKGVIAEIGLPDTKEGRFIGESFAEMTDHFRAQSAAMGGNVNSMQMMASVMQSGLFTKFMTNVQQKIQTGEMNVGELLTTAQQAMTKIVPEGKEGEPYHKIASASAPIVGKIASMVNNMNATTTTNGSATDSPTTSTVPTETLNELKSAASELISQVTQTEGTNTDAIDSMFDKIASATSNNDGNSMSENPSAMVSDLVGTVLSSLNGGGSGGESSDGSGIGGLVPPEMVEMMVETITSGFAAPVEDVPEPEPMSNSEILDRLMGNEP